MSKFKVNSNKKTRLYRLSVSYPDLRTWTVSKREEPGPSLWSQFVLVHWPLMNLFNIPWSHQPDSLKLVEAVLLIERAPLPMTNIGAVRTCLSTVSVMSVVTGKPDRSPAWKAQTWFDGISSLSWDSQYIFLRVPIFILYLFPGLCGQDKLDLTTFDFWFLSY